MTFWTALSAIVGICAGFIAAYVGVIRPRLREQHKRDADAAQAQKLREEELDGVPPIDGVTEGTPRLAVRVWNVEKQMREVVKGQSVLEKRMDEANGTGKLTLELLKHVAARTPGIEPGLVEQLERESHA